MSQSQENIFDNIQKNANMNPNDIYKVANSVQNADFSDEKTVRNLVRQLSKMANKPVSQEKEDKIVRSIVNHDVPRNMQSLTNLFKN